MDRPRYIYFLNRFIIIFSIFIIIIWIIKYHYFFNYSLGLYFFFTWHCTEIGITFPDFWIFWPNSTPLIESSFYPNSSKIFFSCRDIRKIYRSMGLTAWRWHGIWYTCPNSFLKSLPEKNILKTYNPIVLGHSSSYDGTYSVMSLPSRACEIRSQCVSLAPLKLLLKHSALHSVSHALKWNYA